MAALLIALTACAPANLTELSDDDRRAMAQLATIAARDAQVTGESDGVECWVPSENMLSGATSNSAFRVICRVHFTEAETEAARYKDMICLGDLARDPVADYCYQWVPYSDTAAFADQRAVNAP